MTREFNTIPQKRRRVVLCCLLLAQSPFYSYSWSPLKLSSRVAPFPSQPRSSRIRSVLKRIVPFQSSKEDLSEEELLVLKSENTLLRDTIRQLEEENQRLKQKASKIVLETFEGERWFRGDGEDEETSSTDSLGITLTGEEIGQDELWCDELDGGEQVVVLEAWIID